MEIILNNLLVQAIYFILVVLLFGVIVAIINRLFYRLLNYNKGVIYGTAFIGTPIHELSHALFCVIFLHKIEEISLFRISDDGVLGYVNHSYSKRNIYKVAGNYFIGIAPLIVGGFVLYFLTRLLLPVAFDNIQANITTFNNTYNAELSFNTIKGIFVLGKDMVVDIFKSIAEGFKFWIYIILILSISLHMNLSNADIKGALKGLPFFIIIVVIINLIIGLIFKSFYGTYMYYVSLAGGYLLATMTIALIFSLILLIIAVIIRLIINLIKR